MKIRALDGFPLAATFFQGTGRDVIIIQSATGVPRGYYAKFADELCRRGHHVVTFDYRGVGESLPDGTKLPHFDASMADWAHLDVNGIHAWVHSEYPNLEVKVVGHSFGGQVLGLIQDPFQKRIRRAVLVASQNGYWRYFSYKHQPLMMFYWYLLIPLALRIFGYLPMRKFVGGEDIPRSAAAQWRRWCMQPEYLFSELGTPEVRQRYRDFPAPILAFDIRDDAFAGGVSVLKLLQYYPKATTTHRPVEPKEIGRAIGHFGFFKSQFREPLWREAIDWLEVST